MPVISPFCAPPSPVPGAAFSPDGRWIAYASSDNAASEFRIYLRPFPPTGDRFEIAGGIHPAWSPDGTELLFTSGLASAVNSVKETTRPTASIANPTSFFRRVVDGVGPQGTRQFDIRRDGRFVGIVDVNSSGTTQPAIARAPEMRVILNWFTELQQCVPAR